MSRFFARRAAPLTSMVLAVLTAGLFLRVGEPLAAGIAFLANAGLGAFFFFSRSEVAVAAQGVDADERQQELNKQAMSIAYLAVGAVAVVGLFVEIARGDGVGPFAVICAVGGSAHMVSLAVLRRRM